MIAALDWLQDKDSIDNTRIAVMGSSLGGIHALLALSRDKRWKCGLDFSGGASQWNGHTKIRNILLQAAADLTKPVFLIQPENDFNTAPTMELAKILSLHGTPYRATIFPAWGVTGGEAHRFCATGQQIWGPEAKDFLGEFLWGIVQSPKSSPLSTPGRDINSSCHLSILAYPSDISG
ncbi:MAG: alpha/beta hydrolase family protein [Alphaproteobacteria bacterium]